MSAPDLSLLGTRRFAPLFVVQFLGAFNDNLLKFALLFLANFGLYAAEPGKAAQLATIATGCSSSPISCFPRSRARSPTRGTRPGWCAR